MSKSPIFNIPEHDPEMDQASVLARQTFAFFWREVAWERRRIVPGLDMAMIKVAFSDPPGTREPSDEGYGVEHMWVQDVDFDGRKNYGTLANDPNTITSVKAGDSIEITPKRLTDWMYVINGVAYGGFTVDLMRQRMPVSERTQHDRMWGLDFGQIGMTDVVPRSYLGEKPPKKGWFSAAPKPVPQDYPTAKAIEHPMSVNMRTSLENACRENPNFVTERDDAHGFTYLHQLALAGSFDGVDVCIAHGADINAVATNGMTPLALAKVLGWRKVEARLTAAGAK